MNRTQFPLSLAVIGGAFLFYCGGQTADSILGDGGLVSPADAQQQEGQCCTAPMPARTRLDAGSLSEIDQTDAIAVDAYSSVILHRSGSSGCSSYIDVEFLDQAGDQARVSVAVDGRGQQIPVMGNFVRLATNTCGGSLPYVLVGVN